MNQSFISKSTVSGRLARGQLSDPSIAFDVRGICVHNTATSDSAREIADKMKSYKGTAGAHFLVDERETVELVPITQCAFHTGKGYDWGNLHTIAIEICRSNARVEQYLSAEKRAIELIVQLMKRYGFTVDDIYFHRDFNPRKNCPHKIFQLYGTKNEWIERMVKPWL